MYKTWTLLVLSFVSRGGGFIILMIVNILLFMEKSGSEYSLEEGSNECDMVGRVISTWSMSGWNLRIYTYMYAAYILLVYSVTK